jgi:L-malate glycosyltransferase
MLGTSARSEPCLLPSPNIGGLNTWLRGAVNLHIAVVGPIDVNRLVPEFGLRTASGQASTPVLRGGHPAVTSLVIALAPLVDRLDLITLDPILDIPLDLVGGHVRVGVGPSRPRPRDLAKNLFSNERRFIAGRLQAWQPDAVSAHWTYEFALGTVDSGLPHLITVHDWAPAVLWSLRDPYRAVRLIMQLLTFARGRNFAAVSPYMARRSRLLTIRPVSVLPNGLERSWYFQRPHQPSDLRVLAVNHGFARHKNVQQLLFAWPKVLERHPAAELVLAGQGYETDGPASRWAHDNGLAQRVCFLGTVTQCELKDLLQSASVFAHPSLEESFGLVILEAMAQGVPVLGGSRSGAVPWLLGDGAGLLVDVRNSGAIAAGLNKMLTEQDFARMTASRGYKRSLDFSIDEIAIAYRSRLAAITSESK